MRWKGKRRWKGNRNGGAENMIRDKRKTKSKGEGWDEELKSI
jgi:hypothetical protein